jgi:hypothetical protein
VAAAAVVVVSGTALALGPPTWQKPPEPITSPLPPLPGFAAEHTDSVSFGPSVTLNGPTPTATATPSAISMYFLVGQTAPPPTPAPTPVPTPVPDTVANARAYAKSHLTSKQFACVNVLWQAESNWNPRASNPTTGAYGIPQSLPATKMAAAGRNWRTSPRTQVRWGLQYIAVRYGTPCQAWSFRITHGWY